MSIICEVGGMVFNVVSSDVLEKEPLSFNQYWNHPIESLQIKWRNTIMKEVLNMEKRYIWSDK